MQAIYKHSSFTYQECVVLLCIQICYLNNSSSKITQCSNIWVNASVSLMLLYIISSIIITDASLCKQLVGAKWSGAIFNYFIYHWVVVGLYLKMCTYCIVHQKIFQAALLIVMPECSHISYLFSIQMQSVWKGLRLQFRVSKDHFVYC